MINRERLSATVEPDLVEAGRTAVREGRAENLSSWVNDALRRQADHDQRMTALDAFLDAYEGEHGVITGAEMRDATHSTRARAVVIRSPKATGSPSASRSTKSAKATKTKTVKPKPAAARQRVGRT